MSTAMESTKAQLVKVTAEKEEANNDNADLLVLIEELQGDGTAQ